MQIKNIVCLMMLAGFSAALTGCAGKVQSRVKKGEIQQTMDLESIHKKFIEAVGIGAADKAIDNVTQKKATSRNAAVVDAQYRLLSMVKGLRLQGGITVEKAIETDSRLQTIIDAEIKGAEEVKIEWTEDMGSVATMRLDRNRLEKMMGVKFE